MNAKEKQGRVNERVITFESKNLQELFFMDRRCMKKVKITFTFNAMSIVKK